METARAMTLQQSIEVATRNWANIHNTGRCPRCVQCGEMIDPVILHNRGALHGPMATHLAGKMLLSNCLTKNQ